MCCRRCDGGSSRTIRVLYIGLLSNQGEHPVTSQLPDPTDPMRLRHSSHWGAFNVLVRDGRVTGVEPFEHDGHPSPIIESVPSALNSPTRVAHPAIRRSWLEHGPGARNEMRAREPFVTVQWDHALDLLARELNRVRTTYGNRAIFGGSYGWSSAGRFHHAKTQLQRFLCALGGYVDQKHTYSNAAGHAILPYIFGDPSLGRGPFTSWDSVCEHTDLVVSFGGLGLKNTQVEPGGMGEHASYKWLPRLAAAKARVVSITPIRDDTAALLNAQWIAPRPNSDVALMLGIAHTLLVEGLHARQFLASHCLGFERFQDYLLGHSDGQAKSAEWAAGIVELEAAEICALAREMARGRTFITVAYALQRAEHGEQPYWMAATLAAMLGQIGLPGGGVAYGYGSMNGYGNPVRRFPVPALSRGHNPIDDFIPVARISDMLLHPGEAYRFNGEDRHYPDVKLVYWCGGNPFHHHQDINRLLKAWQHPETIVVNEIAWTATARHADIVLPATMSLERNDIGACSRDRFIIAMQKATSPLHGARNDFDIFADLAARLGFHDAFTEGRDEADWLRHLYEVSRQQAARFEVELPEFDHFWRQGYVEIPAPEQPYVAFQAFRDDPVSSPLGTPSGKLEIFSPSIDQHGDADCPGHPVWREPTEWLGSESARRFPLHLISNQPKGKLHSQMDDAPTSKAGKRGAREPTLIHPTDAAQRGINDGDVIRVFNDRGALLSVAEVSSDIRKGVIRISTGAWYDPLDRNQPGTMDKHGNPNVLTQDRGTSSLAQGPVAHSALVDVERCQGEPPAVSAFELPMIDDFD